MKKLYFGIIALLVSATMNAERVSQEDAALVANNFMNPVQTSSLRKATPARRMVLQKAATENENQYYVYNNADGEGWVIIAANDAVIPVLAYSPTGQFRTENMPDNIRQWMGKYDKFIKRIEADGIQPSEETTAEWTRLRKGTHASDDGIPVVGPLITTTWDQNAPFDKYTPGEGEWGAGSDKTAVGCVAAAMAQVMNYWEWPTTGKGSKTYQPVLDIYDSWGYYVSTDTVYPGELTANFGATTYDWNNMRDAYTNKYGDPLSGVTEAEKEAVAVLMYHCGISVSMQYGPYEQNGSGAYTINYGNWDDDECAENALWRYFKYKKEGLTSYYREGYVDHGHTYYEEWSDTDWMNMLKTELDKKHPILYDGAGNYGGHSFICDGYTTANKFHFNWGWSGYNDGYFTLNSLTPGSGGAGGGGYDFSEQQAVIIGIMPDRTDWPKVTVTWSVDGETSTTEFTQHDDLVLPAEPADCSCGKQFVGWTKQATITDGEKPYDLFTSAEGKIAWDPVTYYAVFAKQEGAASPVETKTYTFTSKAWADETHSWTSLKDGLQFDSGKSGVQISRSVSGASAALNNDLDNVETVVVNYCTNTSDGEGSIAVKVGDKTLTQNVTKTGGTTLRDLQYDFDQASGACSFEVTCTKNSIYVHSVTITAGGGTPYSGYSTSCNCSGTDVEQTTNDQQPMTNKVLRDGQVLIQRGNTLYTLTGQEVR